MLGCAVQKLEVVIVQLAVTLGFPKFAQREITDGLLPGINVWSLLPNAKEQFPGGFRVGGTRGNVHKIEQGQRAKQCAVGQEMSLKTGERH